MFRGGGAVFESKEEAEVGTNEDTDEEAWEDSETVDVVLCDAVTENWAVVVVVFDAKVAVETVSQTFVFISKASEATEVIDVFLDLSLSWLSHNITRVHKTDTKDTDHEQECEPEDTSGKMSYVIVTLSEGRAEETD